MRRWLVGAVVLALGAAVPGPMARAAVTSACPAHAASVDIGRSPTEPSRIRDLNDRGDVVGSVNKWTPTNHREQAFVRRNGVLTLLTNGGWTYGEAVAINNRGQVLGTGRSEPLRVDNVILWDAKGNPTKLNPDENGDARAYDLNERGDALVLIGTSLGIWRAGRFTTIPTPAGRRFTEPATLNERGWAVGRTDAAGGPGRIDAWVWDGKRRWDIVSPFGGAYDTTVAVAINNRGQVVGSSANVEGTRSVNWLWERGRRTNLGPVVPVDLDDAGRVLGTITTGTVRRVVIREATGKIRNLGTFGAKPVDGEVTPVAMNNHGQVVVYAGPIGHAKVWLWKAGRTVELPAPAGFQQLSPPGLESYLPTIPDPLNERGEVYTLGTLTNYQTHGVLWPRAC